MFYTYALRLSYTPQLYALRLRFMSMLYAIWLPRSLACVKSDFAISAPQGWALTVYQTFLLTDSSGFDVCVELFGFIYVY